MPECHKGHGTARPQAQAGRSQAWTGKELGSAAEGRKGRFRANGAPPVRFFPPLYHPDPIGRGFAKKLTNEKTNERHPMKETTEINLTPDPVNPNRMTDENKAAMARSLAEFGDLGGIVLNRRTGLLIGGHQRVSVLEGCTVEATDLPTPEPDGTVARGYVSRGGVQYSLRVVDWAEDKAHAALLAANRFGRVGTDDATLLKDLLEELDAGQETDTGQLLADLTGFDAAERERLALQTHQDGDADAEAQVDRAEALNEKWKVNPGDLWLIGDHRLLCGDSTKADDVGRLLGDRKPVLMVTDPPYGVEYDADWRDGVGGEFGHGARVKGAVAGDAQADWSACWALFPGDVAYVWHAGVRAPEVADSLTRSGWDLRSQIVWAKQHFAISRGHYHWKHEPCWYAVRRGRVASWLGGRDQTTVWDIASLNPAGRSETREPHPTQKPVECMARPIRNHEGDVYDPFLGSGTTMVAGQNLGRKVYGLEIVPNYCAVILQRMADAFPGIEIRREEGGAA